MDCDVVVLGSGAAGLSAALKARETGLSVMVLEREPVFGGTTALSEGMIWVPLSEEAKSKGIADTRDAAIAYLKAAAGTFQKPERIEAYVDGASEMLAFVHSASDLRFSLSAYSIDYHQELPGATSGARAFNPGLFDGRRLGDDFARLRAPLASTMILGGMTIASSDLPHFFAMRKSLKSAAHVAQVTARYGRDRLTGHSRGTRIANGNGLVAALALALRQRGVDIHTGAHVHRLVRERGRVTGVEAKIGGVEQIIGAKQGVVLCCGGFPGSLELQSRYYPHVAKGKRHYSLAPQTNVGAGLSLACEAGAALNENLAQPAAWTPVSLVPQRHGPPVPFPHYIDRGKPGVIAVTRQGRRFTNEADVYHRFVPAMIAACEQERDVAVWVIADHRAVRRYGLGAVPPAPARLGPFLANGYLKSGATWAELANATGIEAATLSETIAAFNAHAARGEDPQFGKGSSVYNRANGDPQHRPNPCLAPLAEPPFYAVRVVAGDIATFIGLKTDRYARVLDTSGKPIQGLYAAGNDAASAMGGDYPAAGITIGSAMTFGYLAARHIAGGR
jgi:succinate dehydrogenase/fumarate reductase flavoprotein subunit